MTLDNVLLHRCQSSCELCGAAQSLTVYELPSSGDQPDATIVTCSTCLDQIKAPETMDVNHWRCLSESMWSTVPAVQVMAWRLLKKMESESWVQDQLSMLYLDDTLQAWAEAGLRESGDEAVLHKDSNGNVLAAGDTVVLIKDLDVKGAGFTAKRGTSVRNISLTDNPEHIEGRVNGTRIVLVTRFVKKAN